jgi:hypothetical protein
MKVLEEKLFLWMERLGATKFLQDGIPCHTSKKVMAMLKEKQIIVKDWPVNSPDLNPIENPWAIMKVRLKRVPNITFLPHSKEDHQDDVSEGPPHLPHEEARSLHAQEDPNVHPEPAPRCPSTYLNIFLVCFQTVIQNHFHCNMYCKSQVRMSYFFTFAFFSVLTVQCNNLG